MSRLIAIGEATVIERNITVCRHTRLAVKLALQFRCRHDLPYDAIPDLIQDVLTALVERHGEYNPSHASYLTFACCVGRGAMARSMRSSLRYARSCRGARGGVDYPTPLQLTAQRDAWNATLAILTPRQREIIIDRYREDKTLQQVADKLGITRQAIAQQEEKALQKIQYSLAGGK